MLCHGWSPSEAPALDTSQMHEKHEVEQREQKWADLTALAAQHQQQLGGGPPLQQQQHHQLNHQQQHQQSGSSSPRNMHYSMAPPSAHQQHQNGPSSVSVVRL